MMNEPAVLEASRVFSQKLVSESSTAEEKIVRAFRSIICRTPTAKEQKVLTDYYNEQLQAFQQKKLDAAATLQAGEYEFSQQPDKDQSAALMKVISMVYNLEEAIVK
jgi:hypothetical protein